MLESKYFKADDFKCKCGCGLDIKDKVKEMIFEAREIAQVPFIITSGARCLEHNYAVKSRPTSSHIKGLAVDIVANDAVTRGIINRALTKVGFLRFGHNFKKGFIHVDFDMDKPKPAIFGYGE